MASIMAADSVRIWASARSTVQPGFSRPMAEIHVILNSSAGDASFAIIGEQRIWRRGEEQRHTGFQLLRRKSPEP